mgnify:CR=1 FL=1|tara:strand:- start:800 stop:1450 length:651 start_codon:yes stop_codon:yes gene_type:complete
MKTYKQLVNNILIRLREREVDSINENSYSKLVGLFVHDAIEMVESAWNWSNLRDTMTVTTQEGVFSYALTDFGDKSSVLDVINDTNNHFMTYQTAHWFNNVFLNNSPVEGSPNYYSFNGLNGSGDTQIDIYPVPDGVYDLHFNVIKRSPNILLDDDTVKVPFLPVQALAYAMALEERGEDGGMSAVSAKALSSIYLSDAIAIDANKHPEELIWEAT